MAVNIVLADAQATPVNHTFIPTSKGNDAVVWFTDQSQASPIGFWKISLQLRDPGPATSGQSSTTERNYVATIGLWEPALENVTNSTVSGVAPAPTISYVCNSMHKFKIPERASLQNRKDLRKMAYNLLNEAQVVSMVENLVAVSF